MVLVGGWCRRHYPFSLVSHFFKKEINYFAVSYKIFFRESLFLNMLYSSVVEGLKENQIAEIRAKFGENALPVKEGPFWYSILWSQFKSPLIYVLLFVALLSIILQEYLDTGLILVVLLINVLMGFYQEFNAHRTLAALRRLLKPKTFVIRDSQRKEIEVKELVPQDMVILASGDRIPADGRLVEASAMIVNEAILTGEEEAISKSIQAGSNILFMGTTVLSGRGIMEVEKIGQGTQMGQISQSLSEIVETETPLQKKLGIFARNLVWIILSVSLLIFIIGILKQENVLQMLRFSVILAMAAIPEALPIAITVILALGIRRILKRNGLVKKLLSIETLGSTSVICTDKTGTLTENVMKVVEVDFVDREKALVVLILNNEQKSNLEIALWDYVKKVNQLEPSEIIKSTQRIYDEPFDSEKKYSLSVVQRGPKTAALMMGAPEIVLGFCDLPEKEKKVILDKFEEWANRGLRILALASKEEGNLKEKNGYFWLGLVGIEDPIRSGAKESIAIAQRAGIDIKIVTGDYRKTAERVMEGLGFKLSPANVLEGKDLEILSEKNLKEKIKEIFLFARVTPHQKLKIVRVLQEQGEVVAMTGDGVNDAPALKKSDIGVVVGDASDVAKEAGDLILLDSNFKTIVAACEEGRLILANVKKVVGYMLSNAFAEIILIFGAMILDFPAPLIVVQILWIHLICDGPPDIILGFEPKEKDLMEGKPKDIQKEEILNKTMKFLIFAISLTTGLLSLGLFWYYYNSIGNLELARTIAFVTIAIVSLVYIFSFKNLKKSIFATENFFQNKYLFWGVAYGFLLIFAAVYIPFLNQVLKTVPLTFSHWLPVFGMAIMVTLIVEIVKFLERSRS